MAPLGTHSCKATALSWAAKFGLDSATRRTLGYHSSKEDRMTHVYSRDAIAAPVREVKSARSASNLTRPAQAIFELSKSFRKATRSPLATKRMTVRTKVLWTMRSRPVFSLGLRFLVQETMGPRWLATGCPARFMLLLMRPGTGPGVANFRMPITALWLKRQSSCTPCVGGATRDVAERCWSETRECPVAEW